MFKKILSLLFCLSAVFFLASCEKKTKANKTQKHGNETSQTQNGGSQVTNTQGGNGSQTQGYGSQTQGNQSTTKGQDIVEGTTFTATDFRATGSTYTDLNVTKDGIDYYAHIICKDGKLQFRAPKPDKNKEGAVLMNLTANKTIKSITVVTSEKPYDTRTLNFYGLEEPFEGIDDFEAEGLTPEGTIAITKAGTYTYEFEGQFVYFAFAVTGGSHTFDSITVTFGNGTVEPVEVVEADEALDTALKAINLNNVELGYSYVGKYPGEDDETLDLVISLNNGKVMISNTYDYQGETYTDVYYYEEIENVPYFYFINYESEGGDDYGDIDWGDIDWGDLLSKKNVKVVRKNANDEEEYVYVTGEDAEDYLGQIGYVEFDFDGIVYTDFNKVGSKYEAKSNKVNELGKLIFGDYDGTGTSSYYGYDYDYVMTETFTKLTIELANGKVSKITAKSKYHEVDTWKDDNTSDTYDGTYTYTLTFSKEGQVSFEIPEATKYVPQGEEAKVSGVYELENGASVSLAAYVNGVNTAEKVLYVCDETGSIALHYETLETVPAVGKIVEFTATVKVTGKLYELELTELTIDDEEAVSMIGYEVETLDDKDETYAGEIINLNFAIVKEYDLTNKQIVFTTIGGKDISLKFDEEDMQQIATVFSTADPVGKAVSLKNVAVSLSGDDFILRLTDITSYEYSNGLKTNVKDITVEYDTAIKDVLADLVVTFYQEGVKTVLGAEDYAINDDEYNKTKPGTYTIILTKGDQTAKVFVQVKMSEGKMDEFVEDQGKGIKYAAERYNVNVGLPSTGDVNILVVPVLFTNSSRKLSADLYNNYASILELAFNGTSEQTGWESLKSYYQKVSYGKLNLNATILPAFETGEAYYVTEKEYPEGYLEGYESLDYKYLARAIEYYDSTINYADYDANNDGYIDCVYMVYLAPHSTSNDALDYWWAYTYEYYETGEEKVYDEKGIDVYMWLSIDFFTEELTADDYETVLSYQPTVNAETVIHETGHALGLDDYYDYTNDSVATGGFGGGIMMDTNVGDHDAFSKALLGWINPTIVINKDAELSIEALSKVEGADITKKAIFIAKDYNGVYFNEFYVIYLYTPEGVNEMMKGYSGLPTEAGVMILHVVANPKANETEIVSIWDVTAAHNGNKDNMLITVVEADGDSSISQNAYLDNSDLWQQSGKLTNVRWSDGSTAGFTVEVKTLANGEATIVIDFAE